MCDALPKVTPDVQKLIDMDCEVVTAAQLAPILKMHPQTIIDRVKTGLWDQDRLGKFVISGERVKFFRMDFLQKCGFVEPDPEESTERKAILATISALETILKSQKEVIALLTEQNELLRARIKPPVAATTDG